MEQGRGGPTCVQLVTSVEIWKWWTFTMASLNIIVRNVWSEIDGKQMERRVTVDISKFREKETEQ